MTAPHPTPGPPRPIAPLPTLACGAWGVVKPQKLWLGCTQQQHAQVGIDAVVNARGGQQWRNSPDTEEVEMARDAYKVRDWIQRRVRIDQFNSRHFRRSPIAHLATGWGE